jgi:hypothetical protein
MERQHPDNIELKTKARLCIVDKFYPSTVDLICFLEQRDYQVKYVEPSNISKSVLKKVAEFNPKGFLLQEGISFDLFPNQALKIQLLDENRAFSTQEETNGKRIAQTLDNGADFALVKPLSPEVAEAHIASMLRRHAEKPTVYSTNGITFDLETKTVTKNNEPLSLSSKERTLLLQFVKRPNTVLFSEELEEAIWPRETMGKQNLRAILSRLRSKIEKANQPKLIRNLPGVGYIMDCE